MDLVKFIGGIMGGIIGLLVALAVGLRLFSFITGVPF